MCKTMKNKVALVTGGSSSIGRTIALALTEEFGTILITYSKNGSDADDTIGKLKNKGINAYSYQLDAEDYEGLKGLINHIKVEFQRLDAVVNSIGVSRIGALEKLDFVKDWSYCVNINLHFLFHLIQETFPIMKLNQGGRFINISSVSAFETRDGVAAYSVTKAAQNTLLKFLAKEGGQYGICVNSVCPGMTKTKHLIESNQKLAETAGVTIEEINTRILNDTYTKRMLMPQEIASLVKFLVSDDAKNLTGQSLIIAGGR